MLRKLFPYFMQGIAVGVIGGLVIIVLLWLKPWPHKTEVVMQQAAPRTLDGGQTIASYANAVASAAAAVVNIHTRTIVGQRPRPFFDDPAFKRFFDLPSATSASKINLGSGVIISTQGYIVTNFHVIDGADEINVTLADGRSAPALLVGSDPETDLALLHTELDVRHSIVMADADLLRLGDIVLAIGNPFGLGHSVNQGVISGRGRNQLGLTTFDNYLQTDAAINPGNSGGALINSAGELVGINTAIYSRTASAQGIGFAIPGNLVSVIVRQLIEQGHVVRSWLGIDAQSLTAELAESFGLSSRTGMLISGVARDGPAAQAGLRVGDIITHINGAVINRAQEAMSLISQSTPGSQLEIQLLRQGEALSITATAGSRPLQP